MQLYLAIYIYATFAITIASHYMHAYYVYISILQKLQECKVSLSQDFFWCEP